MQTGRKIKDISGQKFGKLTAIRVAGKNKQGNYLWECLCQCGNSHTVASGNLQRGSVQSCGCLATEVHTKHGRGGRNADYLYRLWHHVRDRCHKRNAPFYRIYGGRGIKLHKPWHDPATFISEVIAEIGERPAGFHSLDRIDNSKGYEPGNIRWATWKEQANNKRNNRQLEHNGAKLNVVQWAEKIGIGESTIRRRLRLGWSVAEALTPDKRKNQFG